MSVTSSAASSTLSRPRTGIYILTALSIALGIYYIHESNRVNSTNPRDRPVPPLTRSNAVRRSRQARARQDNPSAIEETDEEQEGGQDVDDAVLPATRAFDESLTPIIPDTTDTVVDDFEEVEGGSGGSDGRRGGNITTLLFRVSEEATRRSTNIHRGCICNSCGELIRGIRYHCANCADYDLCEPCEAQGPHTKTHIFYKIRIPSSAAAHAENQPVWYPGNPESENAQRPMRRELIQRLMKETGYERHELEAMFDTFTFQASEEWRADPDGIKLVMSREDFEQCLVPTGPKTRTASSLLHDRMFAFFDTNHDELISFPEYVNGIAWRRKKDKTKRIFDAYDVDRDGYVDRKDFLRMFRAYYVLQKQRQDDAIDSLVKQSMNTVHTQRLIASSAPLSSVFGDAVSPLSHGRPRPTRLGPGKSQASNGEVSITDGRGVVAEDSNDIGNREQVTKDSVAAKEAARRQSIMRRYPELFNERQGPNTHWRGLSNPPANVEAMQRDILEALIGNTAASTSRVVLVDLNGANGGGQENHEDERISTEDTIAPLQDPETAGGNNDTAADENAEASDVHDRLMNNFRDRQATLASEFSHVPVNLPMGVEDTDIQAVCGPDVTRENMTPLQKDEVITHAQKRLLRPMTLSDAEEIAKRRIHERWQRRAFHTDAEEGAEPPLGWDDEEELEFDDIESRERSPTSLACDSYDLPEAEKDVGKEILYQVTQQACNELLDVLFKEREDEDIKAMKNKTYCEKHRGILENEHFLKWAALVEQSDSASLDNKADEQENPGNGVSLFKPAWRERPTLPEVELSDIRQRSLDQLLAVAGYEVEGHQHAIELTSSDPSGLNSGEKHELEEETEEAEKGKEEEEDMRRRSKLAAYPSEDDQASHDSKDDKTLDTDDVESSTTRNDQNRPQSDPVIRNSQGTTTPPPTSLHGNQSETDLTPKPATSTQPAADILPKTMPPRTRPMSPTLLEAKTDAIASIAATLGAPSRSFIAEISNLDWLGLYDLYQSGLSLNRAKARGGYGRLDCGEVERIVKEREKEQDRLIRENADPETRGPSLEYLGSWIHFCIP